CASPRLHPFILPRFFLPGPLPLRQTARMPCMFSATIAVRRWTARATIVLVALWSRCLVRAVLRRPYFDAIPAFVLASSHLRDLTMCTVVLAILTVSERS